MEKIIFMRGIKRRYISLAATLVTVLFFILSLFFQPPTYSPNNYEKNYFSYLVILLQVILTMVVFKSKSDETKNMLTTFIIIIAFLYMIVHLTVL